MTHGSLFAGIGGFDLGFERVGLRTIWQVEIDPFCRRVLARHFPDSERFTDIKQCSAANLKAVDVITAGVPCQDVSVAGRRAGLAGERTGLFYEFARILRELRPAWFVFENVPGLFSSNRGRDFAEVLRVLMAECGYGICWRVLDSRFFGVAQRRRRVFIVGRLGGPCPLSVLFEPESSCRHPAPRQEAGPEITGALGGGAYGTGRRSEGDPTLAYVLTANSGGNQIEQNYVASTLGTRMRGQADACADNLIAASLQGGGHSGEPDPGERLVDDNEACARQIVLHSTPLDADRVRKATGLPRGLDSARYRALGNAVTVNVAEWIARRLSGSRTDSTKEG